jgi:hypothetical protein
MSLTKPASAIFAATLAVSLCLATVCRADTIVLTNGRRIIVSNAVREGGKVSGDTPAGRLSLPESMVASIETASGSSGARPTSGQAADLSIGPPRSVPLPDSDPTVGIVIHNGAIDLDALARLDGEAAGGNVDAIARAVAGESAASQFEFGRGNFEQALAHAERGLSFAPDQVTLLLNAAYLHLRRSEYSAAADLLAHARRLAPDSPDVAKLDGWADYGLNKLPEAVAEWQRALQLRPDDDVANALKKAEQDAKIETNFEEGVSAHFVLHYDGGAAPELARAVLGALESDFGGMVSLLNYTPPEPIAVVLYTDKDFADITRAPAWVGALNDGRIRIPVQGLLTVTPELAHVLRHELAHSFVSQKTRGNCPVWLQEGIAQWAEGKTAADDAPMLIDLYNRHDDPSLAALEKSWLALTPDFARVAYAWSLATVEAIVQAGTPVDIDRLLDALSAGSSAEGALRTTLQTNYGDLNRSTADYLRRTYLH